MTDETETLIPPLPDPNTMTPEERIHFVNEVRERMMADPDSVTEDELKHSIDVLRVSRANSAQAAATKRKASAPAAPLPTTFF